ncbi:MAG: hypothetical protein ABI221_00860 [Candidatus Saccharimonadales bacterium]
MPETLGESSDPAIDAFYKPAGHSKVWKEVLAGTAEVHLIERMSTGEIIAFIPTYAADDKRDVGVAINAYSEAAAQWLPNDVRYAGILSPDQAQALLVEAAMLERPGSL